MNGRVAWLSKAGVGVCVCAYHVYGMYESLTQFVVHLRQCEVPRGSFVKEPCVCMHLSQL